MGNKGYAFGKEPRKVLTPPKPKPPMILGVNAWGFVFGMISIVVVSFFVVQCSAYISEPEREVAAPVQAVEVPTGFASIAVAEFMGPVAGYPGYALVVPAADLEDYNRLASLSRSSAGGFMEELNTGRCALIANGKVVQLILQSGEAGAWWQIRYNGRSWWILGRFMTDDAGNPMGST